MTEMTPRDSRQIRATPSRGLGVGAERNSVGSSTSQAPGDRLLRTGVIEHEAKRHERTIKQIEATQQKLIQLFYNDRISEDVVAVEQDMLKAERRSADQLRTTATAQLDDVQEALELALSRVEQPQAIYRDGTPMERRVMNRAIFERIEVGPDAEITGTTLTPIYDALSAWHPGLGRPSTCRKAEGPGNGVSPARVRPLFAPVH
jgi:hypothetical protein